MSPRRYGPRVLIPSPPRLSRSSSGQRPLNFLSLFSQNPDRSYRIGFLLLGNRGGQACSKSLMPFAGRVPYSNSSRVKEYLARPSFIVVLVLKSPLPDGPLAYCRATGMEAITSSSYRYVLCAALSPARSWKASLAILRAILPAIAIMSSSPSPQSVPWCEGGGA